MVANQSLQLGDQFANEKKSVLALNEYKKYLDLSPDLGIYRNLSREAEVNRKIAYIFSIRGRYDSSIYYLNEAFILDTVSSNNAKNIIDDLNLLAIHKAYLGNYKEALADIQNAKTSYRLPSSNSLNEKVNSDLDLSQARILYKLGEYSEAVNLLEKCQDKYEKLPNAIPELIESITILADIYKDYGEYERSSELVNSAKSLCIENGLNYAKQLHISGDILLITGNLEQGLEFHLKGLNQSEKANITPLIINSNLKIGDAYNYIGDEEKAREYYQKALDIQNETLRLGFNNTLDIRLGSTQNAFDYFESQGVVSAAALSAKKIGDKEFRKGAYQNASKYYQNALEYYTRMGHKAGILQTNLNLTKSFIKLGKVDSAFYYYNKINEVHNNISKDWEYWYVGAQLDGVQGNRKSAYSKLEKSLANIELTRSGISIQELRSTYLGSKNVVYEYMIDFLTSKNNENNYKLSFYWNEKARSRSFLDLIATRAISPKNESDAILLKTEQSLRLKLSQLTREINTSNHLSSDLLNEFTQTNQDYDSIRNILIAKNEAYNSVLYSEPYGIEEIQQDLEEDEIIIEYWIGEKKSHIWVITINSFDYVPLDITEEELNRKISSFRNSINYQVTDAAKIISRELFTGLIDPVLSKAKNFTKWIIIPHRVQNFIPFQSFTLPDDEFLIERHEISYAPSASIFKYCRTRQWKGKESLISFALGDLSINGLPPLPASLEESSNISALFESPAVFIAEESKESLVKKRGSGYKHVHLATHGVFNPKNPMASYLLFQQDELDDGYLTTSEIFQLDLDASIVTLSACETGLGKINRGNDLVGLSRAIIYSGANAVIVSLWEVDDVATSEIIINFYRYIKKGYRVKEALTKSQIDFLNTNQNKRDLIYWSPFIIIGDGNI